LPVLLKWNKIKATIRPAIKPFRENCLPGRYGKKSGVIIIPEE
jgi:hypothetical protein